MHCRQATSKRQTAFRVRARDPQWLAGIDDALSAVAASQFLQGDNDRNWRADIDWFLRPDSLTRILEGKYSSKSQVASLYADLDHQAAASNGRTA
ncbi:MAG TPA: hypothetical protein VFV87_03135 [Pirellulaceae bacterium]|nr:hypothetical protein [Pirellulaceae bacterium]